MTVLQGRTAAAELPVIWLWLLALGLFLQRFLKILKYCDVWQISQCFINRLWYIYKVYILGEYYFTRVLFFYACNYV